MVIPIVGSHLILRLHLQNLNPTRNAKFESAFKLTHLSTLAAGTSARSPIRQNSYAFYSAHFMSLLSLTSGSSDAIADLNHTSVFVVRTT